MTTASRYTIVAAVGAIYAVAIALLVGAEGRSYRESLREARARRAEIAAVAPIPASVPAGSGDPRPAPGGSGALSPDGDLRSTVSAGSGDPRPAPVPAGSGDPRPAPSAVTAGSGDPRPAPQPTSPPTPTTSPSDKSDGPTVAANVPVPKRKAVPKKAKAPAERSAESIWADSLDLSAITDEQEMRLGADLDQLVRASNPEDRDGDIERLKRAADPFLKALSRPGISYKFLILASDEVNAFSLPGGYIYVSTGLFKLVGEDVEPEDDYPLQFVVGHEIAHVDLKHTLKVIASGNAAAKKEGVDTLSQCMLPVGLGYPDVFEFAADAWAYEQMTRRAARTHREASMFLTQYKGFSKKHGFPNGRLTPDPKSGLNLVENHFRAHPAAWDRLARLKPAVAQAPEVAPKPR